MAPRVLTTPRGRGNPEQGRHSVTTLFDSAAIVKPSTFAAGLLTGAPDVLDTTAAVSATDAAWAAQVFGDVYPDQCPELPDDYDFDPAELEGLDERAAAEAAAGDCIECGLLPPDLGDYLSRTSLVGH